jgi:hypothetical protein
MALIHIRSLLAAAVSSAALMGCLPASTTAMDGGTDTTTAAITYTKDVQPILAAKCSPCHAGQSQGQQNIVTNYDDVNKDVVSTDAVGCWNDDAMTMPKKMGECALILARSGRMPYAMGCDQMPTQAVCVTAAEQDVMAAWIAAGMPR